MPNLALYPGAQYYQHEAPAQDYNEQAPEQAQYQQGAQDVVSQVVDFYQRNLIIISIIQTIVILFLLIKKSN